MWPLRSNPRRRAIAALRRAQADGRACVQCGRPGRHDTATYAGGIHGWACPACGPADARPTATLPRLDTRERPA